ncbi:MAG: hypothetical protein ABFD69_07680 [Candidatus Sumerlaeia bacterium]
MIFFIFAGDRFAAVEYWGRALYLFSLKKLHLILFIFAGDRFAAVGGEGRRRAPCAVMRHVAQNPGLDNAREPSHESALIMIPEFSRKNK